MSPDKLLKQGIAALKAGRKAEARDLLMQVVEQDERNEMAWLWLSGAVETEEERRICLENVLAINPNNSGAQRGLEGLRKTSPELFSGSRQVETSLWRIGEPKPDPEASSPVPASEKEAEKEPLQQAIAAIEAGDKEEGKRLLVDVLKQDEENETAWLWMSRCVDDQEVKRECFERVLEINPENDLATKRLRRLETLSKVDKSSGGIKLLEKLNLTIGIALVLACLVGIGALWVAKSGRLSLISPGVSVFTKSPEDVYYDFADACYSGDFATAESLVTEQALRENEGEVCSLLPDLEGMIELDDSEPEVEISGNTAHLTWTWRGFMEIRMSLFKVKNSWKIRQTRVFFE